MSSSELLIYDHLATEQGAPGVRSIKQLVNPSIRRFTTSELIVPPIEIFVLMGPPNVGKSTLRGELREIVIPEHPKIREWEEKRGRRLVIEEATMEDWLPKKGRTYSEAEYHNASDQMGQDIVRKMQSLAEAGGYLFVEAPAIMGLKLVVNDSVSNVPIGYERGNTPLYYLAHHWGGYGTLQFQNFNYEASYVCLFSEASVSAEGLMARRLKGHTEDAELQQVLERRQSRMGVNSKKLGGASPEQTLDENRRLNELIRLLDEIKVIKIPRSVDNYSLRAKVEYYMPYYFNNYLEVSKNRIYCGTNIEMTTDTNP